MTKFDCEVKIRLMQEDDKSIMWVGSWISWFKAELLVIVSILEPSREVTYSWILSKVSSKWIHPASDLETYKGKEIWNIYLLFLIQKKQTLEDILH